MILDLVPILVWHKILPFDKIFKKAKIQYMHSVYYEYLPRSFFNTWTKNDENNLNQNLCNDDLFMLPNPRIELFKKLPMYSLRYEWNNSGVLKYYGNEPLFKYALKGQGQEI